MIKKLMTAITIFFPFFLYGEEKDNYSFRYLVFRDSQLIDSRVITSNEMTELCILFPTPNCANMNLSEQDKVLYSCSAILCRLKEESRQAFFDFINCYNPLFDNTFHWSVEHSGVVHSLDLLTNGGVVFLYRGEDQTMIHRLLSELAYLPLEPSFAPPPVEDSVKISIHVENALILSLILMLIYFKFIKKNMMA